MTMTSARLTHADLADRLALPLSTVVDLRKREGWPHVRLGKAVRFTEEQVEQIVRSHVVIGKPKKEENPFPGHQPHRPRIA